MTGRTSVRSSRRRSSAVLALLTMALGPLALVACEGPPPNCDSSSPPFDLAGESAADPGCPDGPSPEGPLPGPAIPVCEGCGSGTGEPHLRTFDQRRYDLQAAAEVVATRSLVDDFEVQWRLEPYGSSVSVIGAAAFRLGGERFEVRPGDDEPLRIDGEVVAVASGEQLRRASGVSVRRDRNTYAVVGEGGAPWVTTDVWATFLNVEVGLAADQRGRVEGVLGDADGDPANDLVADGNVLPLDPDFEDIYPALADSWRVDAETTLFDHAEGAGPDDYWDPAFPEKPIAFEDLAPEVRAEAEAACLAAGVTDPDLLEDCTFDLAVTGDATYAEAAAQRQDRRETAPRTGSTGRARWDWLSVDQERVDAPLLVDRARHVIITATDRASDTTVLTALDLESGEPAWAAEGTSASCTAAVTDSGVVALTDDGDPATLVLIDDATGQVRGTPRYTPDRGAGDPPLDGCRSALVATEDTIVGAFGTTVRGFSSTDLRPVWQVELPAAPDLRPLAASEGRRIWLAFPDAGGRSTRVVVLDAASGDRTAEGVLEDVRVADPESGIVIGDDLALALDATSDGDRAGSVSRLEVSGSSIRPRWESDLGGPGSSSQTNRVPRRLAVAGRNLVGFTSDRVVSAFALDDGSRQWSHEASSFTNNGGLVAGDDAGRTYLSAFAGTWLEIVGPDGDTLRSIAAETIFGPAGVEEVRALGPIVDGAVLTLSPAIGGGIAVAAVEVVDR